MSWINSRGATIQKLLEHGNLWVVERLPHSSGGGPLLWVAQAEKKNKVYHLYEKWVANTGIQLPKSTEARSRFFIENVLLKNPSPVLVIEEAHLLDGATIASMRSLAERAAPVIFVGDVAKIRVATDQYADFYQRANYLIDAVDIF